MKICNIMRIVVKFLSKNIKFKIVVGVGLKRSLICLCEY